MLKTTVIEKLEGQDVNEVACHIHKDVTDEEIEEIISLALPDVEKENRGWVCAINGYDDDERELYTIPEAIELCKRLVKLGLISILTTSTLIEKDERPWISKHLGAIEIWAIATGYLDANGELVLTKKNFAEFQRVLADANNLVTKVTKDGQHRTRRKM